MKIKLTLILFILLCAHTAWAQQDNIWYFGYRAGLDFNTGNPVALTNSQMMAGEGCSSIADLNGQLLFYTNGIDVWNKNHQIMQNGTGLLGHQSSTQSALIVPKPGNENSYYIFTTAGIGGPDGLRYSEVDMTANGGLGVVLNKNIPLITPVCEKVSAAWHSNGTDIWVVTHEWGTNAFYAYLVTANGVNAEPVISNTGVVIGQPHNAAAGNMKISPDGSKLAIANDYHDSQLMDFDNGSGAVSNPVSIGFSGYCVEFSPSSNLLYYTDLFTIYQFNLEAADVAASQITILEAAPGRHFGIMQTGPDGKIYIVEGDHALLSVINNPDVLGIGCNLVQDAIDLQERFNGLGLPGFLPKIFTVDFSVDDRCVGSPAQFSIASSPGQPQTVHWDFGDGNFSTEMNPSHEYVQAGVYTVILTASRQGITRVVQQDIEILLPPTATQPPDMTECGDPANPGTAVFYLDHRDAAILNGQPAQDFTVTYHLSAQNATEGIDPLPNAFHNTTNPQMVYARVSANTGDCYALTFFWVMVRDISLSNMPDTFALCKDDTITIEAPAGFDAYSWSTGEAGREIEVSEAGTYTLTVFLLQNEGACQATKSIMVYEAHEPVISHIEIGDWTDDENSIAITATGDGPFLYSLDNVVYQDSSYFSGLESGLYTVYVKNNCGITQQDVSLLNYPKFFTPNNDGTNDTWYIPYSLFEPDMHIAIFDRYGKHIISFKGGSIGWDGKLNGYNLPSTDYWFLVQREDGRQHRGHFSLLR